MILCQQRLKMAHMIVGIAISCMSLVMGIHIAPMHMSTLNHGVSTDILYWKEAT